MYEDSWYSFVPESSAHNKSEGQHGNRQRRQSLLKQPDETDGVINSQDAALPSLYEHTNGNTSPLNATVARRAKSYSDFYTVARAYLAKDAQRMKDHGRQKEVRRHPKSGLIEYERKYAINEDHLLIASQEEFLIYRDQLSATERHLYTLVYDTTSAIDIMASLSQSFRTVEAETTAFQAQCEDLLREQKRLKALGDEVGDGLQYYSYLEPVTRRLNAPGVSRAIADESILDILENLDACINYLSSHPSQRDSDVYCTRYRAVRAKMFQLIHIRFSDKLQELFLISKKRAEASPITITQIYLLQAPETNMECQDLERTIGFLRGRAGTSRTSADPVDMETVMEYQEYWITYTKILDDYLQARKSLIKTLLDRYVAGLRKEVDMKKDFAKFARECLQDVLEICGNESSKYDLIFHEDLQHVSESRGRATEVSRYEFDRINAFLGDFCGQGIQFLLPELDQHDIIISLQLNTWLSTQYDDASANEPTGWLQSDQEALSQRKQRDRAAAKAYLAGVMRNKLIQHTLGRMKSMLEKDIQRFEGSPKHFKVVKTVSDEAEKRTADNMELFPEDLDLRAEQVLGPNYKSAYPPVKTGIRLLILYHDLTYDTVLSPSESELATSFGYDTFHEASVKVNRDALQNRRFQSLLDMQFFRFKNLLLLNNIRRALEISTTRVVDSLDFRSFWDTIGQISRRGNLFDVRHLYDVVRSSSHSMLPTVVQTEEDANAWTETVLREAISWIREHAADLLFDSKTQRPTNDSVQQETFLKSTISAYFPADHQMLDTIWEAIQETIELRRRKGATK